MRIQIVIGFALILFAAYAVVLLWLLPTPVVHDPSHLLDQAPPLRSRFLNDRHNQNNINNRNINNNNNNNSSSSSSLRNDSKNQSQISESNRRNVSACDDSVFGDFIARYVSAEEWKYESSFDGDRIREPVRVCDKTSDDSFAVSYTRGWHRKYEPLAGLTKSRSIGSKEKRDIERFLASPTMKAILPAIENDEWRVRGGGRRRFERCAVVGNSGVLLNSSAGARIDAHDVVMRLNWPPLKGFEGDVGRKTTHMLVNRKSLHGSHWPPYTNYREYIGEGNNSIANPTIVALLHFGEEFAAFGKWAMQSRRPPLRALTADFRRAASAFVRTAVLSDAAPKSKVRKALESMDGPLIASSGLIGALLALGACRETTLFGFGTSAHSGNGHYWAARGDLVREWKIHDFGAEQHVLRLVERGRAQPSWLDDGASRLTLEQPAPLKHALDAALADAALPDPGRAANEYNGAARAQKAAAHRQWLVEKRHGGPKPKQKRSS